MSKKMLIDASHPEETRVVIVDGTRVEELDYESENKRQLRGNVYLARVTRVEPSLQAAFVEYGGNRHGFLAFSEIHPDYYQIPHEDRAALIKAEQEENLEEEQAEEQALEEKAKTKAKKSRSGKKIVQKDDEADSDKNDSDEDEDNADEDKSDDKSDASKDDADDSDDDDNGEEDVSDASEKEAEEERKKMHGARRKRKSKRRYKIQEVVKRGQILLIQAVKEERGNKGAAMTTYLSLAGRYCVLMPNTPRGGGISRKIANGSDRKRLKSIMSELSVPQGMGVIVRTAGAKRTKDEIKRDYDYLSRLWDTIRDTTLNSIAPALIHEEGNLVKRSIRDLYGKDIDSILVQGESAFKLAKDFIEMLMPSHAKNVQEYNDDIPLFLRYQVEQQIESCLEPVAQLKSGGYLVIHPTEALVSVDVNSGRSTKERNVERTALKTNLEAAEEVARQMRLRDLAGLIVIDFIDMDENRNNRAVEKKMRDALSRDRARVQHSRISQFGLMEISRQRRRRSLLEGSTASCEHCHGVGRKRSVESSALKAVRAIEEEGIRGRSSRIRVKVTPDVASYLFNEKRELINKIQEQFDMFAEIVVEPTFIRPHFEVERLESKKGSGSDPLEDVIKENRKANQKRRSQKPAKPQNQNNEDKPETSADGEDNKPNKRKRRRGRRGGRGRSGANETAQTSENTEAEVTDTAEKSGDKPDAPAKKTRARRKPAAKKADADVKTNDTATEEKPKRTRRKPAAKAAKADAKIDDKAEEKPKRKRAPAKKPAAKVKAETAKEEKPKPAPRKRAAKPKKAEEAKTKPAAKAKPAAKKKPAAKPKAEPKPKAAAKPKPAAKTPAKAEPKPAAKNPDADTKPKKSGWWQKRNPFG